MRKTLLACVLLLIATTTPAQAVTQVHSEVVSFNGNITCPDLYPIKTGSSSGGIYTTTCYSELAWSLYMLGGDDWQSWVDGTYVAPEPEPTPTPTVTVTAAPIVQTRTVVQVVPEPCLVREPPATRKETRLEIRRLAREIRSLRATLKDTPKLNR
jgi:hypothetical protein